VPSGRSLVIGVAKAVHRLRRIFWRARGARARGVLAVPLTAEGMLVLVRLTYAPGWRLPGGGAQLLAALDAAALRELSEEIGMSSWGEVAAIDEFDHGPADRGISSLFLVRDVAYAPKRTYEVEEVGEFPPDALPPGATPLTRAKVALALPLLRRA
jgi:ADP-ribose pyrophosphatase YjhB (NUDIX family)